MARKQIPWPISENAQDLGGSVIKSSIVLVKTRKNELKRKKGKGELHVGGFGWAKCLGLTFLEPEFELKGSWELAQPGFKETCIY